LKNSIKILFLILILISCKNKKQDSSVTKGIFYYPNEVEFFKNNKNPELNFKLFNNLNELIDSLDSLNYYGKKATFKITENSSEYNFISCYLSHPEGPPPFIKFKNIIGVSKDSVFKNKPYPIDSLQSILKKDILNFGKLNQYSDSPERLIIIVNVEIDELENSLIELFEYYNEIKSESTDSIKLNINFSRWLEPRPPPPVPVE